MRIVLVTSGYAPAVGGLETATQKLASVWKQAGHEVRVITNRSSRRLLAYEEIGGIPVSRFYFLWELPRRKGMSVLKFLVQLFIFPFALWSLWKLLNPRETDLVSIHYVGPPAWWATLFAKSRSIPVVITLHGSDLMNEPQRSAVKRFMLRQVLKLANGITAVSHFIKGEMERRFPELRGKAAVISNGFDAFELTGIEGIPRERPYGLCVARLSYRKGYRLLIDAFECLGPSDPGFDLILLGNGPDAEAIENRISQSLLCRNVYIRGKVPHREALSLMKTARFVVIPSNNESFCLVAVEARALGRPIVALKSGALPEVLSGYRGVTWVTSETPKALAEAMKSTLQARPVGQETDHSLDGWDIVAGKYVDFFSSHCSRYKA